MLELNVLQPQAAVARAGAGEQRTTHSGNRPQAQNRPSGASQKVAFDEDDIPF